MTYSFDFVKIIDFIIFFAFIASSKNFGGD